MCTECCHAGGQGSVGVAEPGLLHYVAASLLLLPAPALSTVVIQTLLAKESPRQMYRLCGTNLLKLSSQVPEALPFSGYPACRLHSGLCRVHQLCLAHSLESLCVCSHLLGDLVSPCICLLMRCVLLIESFCGHIQLLVGVLHSKQIL